MPFKHLPKQDGPITTAIREAIRLRHELLAGGMSEAEVDRIVGQGLKGALSNPRVIPWRFYCDRCKDTGWIAVMPSAHEMERLTRLYGEQPAYQGYVEKCEPCAWTQKQREDRRRLLGNGDEDFEAAGRTQKRLR